MDNSSNPPRPSSGDDVDMVIENLSHDVAGVTLANGTTSFDSLSGTGAGLESERDVDVDIDMNGWSLADTSPFTAYSTALALALSLGPDELETRQSTAAQVPEGSEVDLANAMVLTLRGRSLTLPVGETMAPTILVPRVMHWKPSPREDSRWATIEPAALGTVLANLSGLMSSGEASFEDLPECFDEQADDRLVQDDTAISAWTDTASYNGQGTSIVVNNQYQVFLVPSLTSAEQQVVADNVSGLPLSVTDYDVSQIAQWHRET